ncbi:hypothetical protein [uncultured Tyzzerella sp.]|uniref:hypothetical protein n=1 Tax=uncultured Tyzzerella sp. TaxID=2321398 RepID=UPI0029431941|nr:hypothetical protein [uncultured Tyzzerella sp.]
MRKTKKVLTEQEEIYEIYCNMCGKPIDKDQFGKFYDYLSVDKNWSYLSHLDGKKHSFDLCENCYFDIINNFKIRVLDDEY